MTIQDELLAAEAERDRLRARLAELEATRSARTDSIEQVATIVGHTTVRFILGGRRDRNDAFGSCNDVRVACLRRAGRYTDDELSTMHEDAIEGAFDGLLIAAEQSRVDQANISAALAGPPASRRKSAEDEAQHRLAERSQRAWRPR